MATIQERLRSMKQREASAITRLSRPYICQLVTNKRGPSIPVLLRLADILKCTPSDVVASLREWAAAAESAAAKKTAASKPADHEAA